MLHSFWLYPLLFLTAGAAGLVDSIAGGGGLVTLPVLLGVGIPPTIALGTNKLQSSFGSFTASYHYVRTGVVTLRETWFGVVCTLVGAALGTWTVQQISARVLTGVIPFLLAAILIYSFFAPKFGERDALPRMRAAPFYLAFGIPFGFYDGFFGPGIGSFWAVALILALGMNLRKATGYTKVMNFASNVTALTCFVIGGNVWFPLGACMAAGQIIGARIGSGMVVRKGAHFIRPVFIAVVAITTLKLIYSAYF